MAELLSYSLPLVVFVAGVALTVAEALVPGAHFIVLGVALMLAGLLGLAFPPLGTPLALAATTLLAGGGAFWVYHRLGIYQGGQGSMTTDADALRGRIGRVTERVTPTSGEVKLDDGGFNPYYRARTMDGEIPEGEDVIVLDPGGGNVLTVESIGAVEDDIDRELARERERETDDAA